MFSISFRKFYDKKDFDRQFSLLAPLTITSTAHVSSVFLLSQSSKHDLNQSVHIHVHVFSLVHFLNLLKSIYPAQGYSLKNNS